MPRIPLAPYGLRELSIISAVSLVGIAAGIVVPLYPLIAAFALVVGFAVFFFRDPERQAPDGDELLLSPADGTVTDVKVLEEAEFIGGPATRVGVFMSLLNVHVNRSPCTGTVAFVRHVPGKFHNAMHTEAASLENESNLIGIERPDGTKILVRQIAGVIARRIVCTVRVGDELSAGQRLGMIKFGSRLEVYAPADAQLDVYVKPGDLSRAGQTVLGVLR